MKRRILGFQRRVWCPKWTPASSNCFMVTAMQLLRLSPPPETCPLIRGLFGPYSKVMLWGDALETGGPIRRACVLPAHTGPAMVSEAAVEEHLPPGESEQKSGREQGRKERVQGQR